MYWTRFIALLFVLYVASLFNVQVPKNVNEKFKYRMLCASRKFVGHACSIHGLLYPGVLSYIQCRRSLVGGRHEGSSSESFAPTVKLRRESFDGVKVNIYLPPSVGQSDLLPGFIYLHGGGLALGDVGSYDGMTRQISEQLNAVVISIAYRRTPENIFPVPYEDSLRAARWFLQNSDQYGVDPRRVAIGGDSAGGYLSAVVSQAIHDEAETPDFRLQVLIYPWTQMLDFKTPSYQQHPDDYLTTGAMAWFTALHLFGENISPQIMNTLATNNHTSDEFRNSATYGEALSHSLVPTDMRPPATYTPPSKGDTVSEFGVHLWAESKDILIDPTACPILRADLSGLPTAYIVTVEVDPLRDDGIMYAKRLEQAGVDVTWRHYESGFHGIWWTGPWFIFEDGRKIFRNMIEFVKPRL